MKKLFASLIMAGCLPAFATTIPLGTYTINYHDNAAGAYTDQSNPDYSQANPYFGNLIAPGPVFINAIPGTYQIVVDAGGGSGVWSGDSTGGTFLVTGHAPGESITFQHSFGQIALYFWDWYPYDNSSVETTLSVYRIESVPEAGGTGFMILAGFAAAALVLKAAGIQRRAT